MIHPQWMYQAIAAEAAFVAVVVIAWSAASLIANHRRHKANTPRGDRNA